MVHSPEAATMETTKKPLKRSFDCMINDTKEQPSRGNGDPGACVLKSCNINETDAYHVDVTGASVTAESSVSLVHRYCTKLPVNKLCTPKPHFRFLLEEESYKCEMTLPPNAAFQIIVGPPCRNSHLSKQLVCLDACKKLHQMGALNDHLLPSNEEPSEDNHVVKNRELPSGEGTTKRKELHGTTCVRAVSGTWGEKIDGTRFHAYKINFACSKADERYSSYALLLESKLDDDVGDVEVDLYLVSKSVKSSVAPWGKLYLDVEQVVKAKSFQELFFNGIFGKLFIGSKASGGQREFLLQTNKSLWDPSRMYLLLPLELPDISCQETWRINWRAINSSVSAVEFLKNNAWLSAAQLSCNGENSSLQSTNSSTTDLDCSRAVYLANRTVHMNNLNQVVVLAIHTGKIYSILELLPDTSAESPFDGNTDDNPPSYSSFADYFSKKYGIVLARPEQPLLLLKQSHRAHNLLVDFNGEGTFHGKKKQYDNKMNVDKQRNHIRMPPELLVSIDVRIDVMKSFYLLPSLMHRLESLMLASQLREEITPQSTGLRVSSSLILEALTTLRCNESFSMERLELLGDSVLKYAVSCHRFLKYPKEHEGQLSDWRSRAVCNSTLHKVGIDRRLQGYIRDSAFDPCRWTAPGQLSIRLCPCDHGLDTLEVPLESKFQTKDTKVVVGKCCDKGHRWMGSKTIADCVEALIGAYYIDGGLGAALQLMKWLDIDAELNPSLVDEAITRASLRSYVPKEKEIEILQSKIGFDFSVKGLLLEAMTHSSEQEEDEVGYCYERLEFLGDSVLDILITLHLYQNHTDIDPGELTDLRSASVNNENFAQAAVRGNLHPHLQHKSSFLQSQIPKYVDFVSGSCTTMSCQGTKGPKALGDLVESIAGAILIDTKLNLEEVWRIFKPLLSPIVTPDKLELPPLRELIELCDSLGYFIKDFCTTKGDTVHAELRLQLKDILLVGEGYGPNRKAAKGQAALFLLKDLESRGISKRKTQGPEHNVESSFPDSHKIFNQKRQKDSSQQVSNKRSKTTTDSSHDKCPVDVRKSNIPVLASINMKKGGPRTSLYAICKRLQWPMPTFASVEQKSRTPIEIGEGPERRKGFNSFVSRITLTIPDFGVMELRGGERADKKSSFDSAALLMLYELERKGKLTIEKV